MEILFFALGLLVAGAVNIACFVAGASIVQKTAKGRPVQPELQKREKSVKAQVQNPEDDTQRQKLAAILENIERYDGSPEGQKNIP